VEIGARDALQCVREDGAFRAVELVEQRLGIADLREPNLLLLEVVGVELLNLPACAAHHDVFEHPLAQFVGVLLDRRDVILGVVEAVQILEPIAQPLEESLQIAEPGYGAVAWRLEELQLAVDVVERVVVGRSGNEDDPLALADAREVLVALRRVALEAVGFVDEDVFIELDALLDDLFELADGDAFVAGDAEIAEDARPRAGTVFIEEARRRDDEAAGIELQHEQRGDVRLAEADDIRNEDAAVGLEHLLCGEHRVLLVLQLPEILRQIFRVQLRAIAEVVAEVFGEKLEVEFIGREERERRFLLHGVEDRLS
jgi:hypothetical protein